MSTDNHTPYAVGGPLTQVAMESPLGQLDAAIEDVRAIAEAAAAGGGGGGGGGTTVYVPVIDARAYGQVGDGVHDDTAACQAAIDFASRSLGPRSFRLGNDSGFNYTLKVIGGSAPGTTITIAAGASRATITAALETVVGAGKVTMGTNAGDGGTDIIFAQSLGNVDLLSSYYYGSPPTQGPIIYPRPGAAGVGGDVYIFGLARITSTLLVSSPGVRVWAGQQLNGFYAGMSVAALRGGSYSSGLLWGGANNGGPIIRFRPSGLYPLTGVGFTGNLIGGDYPFTSAAATGIEITGVTTSRFDYISALEFKGQGVHLFTNLAARGTLVSDWSVSYCQFGIIATRHMVNPGVGLRVQGDRFVGGFIQTNVYSNTFMTIQQQINSGHGSVWGDCDTNWVQNTSCWQVRGESIWGGVASTNLITTTVAHEFVVGDTLYFTSLTGGAGLVLGTPYYVIATGLTTTTFKVSATPGGAEFDFTSNISAGTVAPSIGVYLEASNTGDGGSPRLNVWQQVIGSFYSEGTEHGETLPTFANTILQYYPDIGGHSAPTTPMVGVGADVTWNNWRNGSPPVMAGTSFPW